MADVFVSWAELQIAPASVVRSASASQTVDDFGQTATAVRITSAVVDVSFAQLQVPSTALSTLNVSASQQVGDFTQSATLSDSVGQINGGGVITEQLPHRSVGGTQSVGSFPQSANIGPDGAPGPALVVVAQAVGEFVQVATATVQVDTVATQRVDDFGQVATVIDPDRVVVVPDQATGGGYGHGYSRLKARKKGRTVYADTWNELAEALRRMDEADEPDEAPPRIKRARVLPAPPPDPLADMRAEMAKQRAELETQMAQLQMMALQGQQAVAQQYEARIAGAEQAARGAIAIAQRAKQDADALAALLTN